jgi:hypothetical protein
VGWVIVRGGIVREESGLEQWGRLVIYCRHNVNMR